MVDEKTRRLAALDMDREDDRLEIKRIREELHGLFEELHLVEAKTKVSEAEIPNVLTLTSEQLRDAFYLHRVFVWLTSGAS
mmetsp:Transcript_22332/g.69959  ORF Transcript_22332/g.69959 Transcript_22332/m.69959 type:complete len:81 (-) Transcript_22332:1917-2159(-)